LAIRFTGNYPRDFLVDVSGGFPSSSLREMQTTATCRTSRRDARHAGSAARAGEQVCSRISGQTSPIPVTKCQRAIGGPANDSALKGSLSTRSLPIFQAMQRALPGAVGRRGRSGFTKGGKGGNSANAWPRPSRWRELAGGGRLRPGPATGADEGREGRTGPKDSQDSIRSPARSVLDAARKTQGREVLAQECGATLKSKKNAADWRGTRQRAQPKFLYGVWREDMRSRQLVWTFLK